VLAHAAVTQRGRCGGNAGGAARIGRRGVERPDRAFERGQDAGGAGTAATAARIEQVVVVGPIPVDARIGVGLTAEVLVALDLDAVGQHVDAAAGRALVGRRAGDRAVAGAEVPHQRRRGVVHRRGVPRTVVDIALVFDAERVGVVVAYVPAGVGVAHHLRDLAIGTADHVVRTDVGCGVLEPRNRAGIAALRGVKGHGADRGAARGGVVAGMGHVPDCRAVVGALALGLVFFGGVEADQRFS